MLVGARNLRLAREDELSWDVSRVRMAKRSMRISREVRRIPQHVVAVCFLSEHYVHLSQMEWSLLGLPREASHDRSRSEDTGRKRSRLGAQCGCK